MELLAGFDAVQIAVAIVATLAAAFIRGLAGFGLAILLVPVLALAITPVEAVLATNVVALLIGLSEIRRLMREAESSSWIIGLLVIVGTPVGLIALAATSPDLARMLIAICALSAFAVVLLPRRPADLPGKVSTGLTGLSSGLLTGFAGMPGIPVVPYYLGRDIPKEIARASMLLIFTIAATAGIGSGIAIGVMEWRLVGLGVLLFPVVLVGNYLGTLAFGKISDKVWRTFTVTVLGGTAIAALIKLL
ncbi:sulfite exporter TauE/SafE family protein [Altererythrobacter sp. ZODW24]|uniref:sulfite exporter TauE/SafE family protein n=1 Tax=Altererythrobacter sp. ZODW24 TaxID=2185142 RepID=UPI000DF78B10|nr:sulfite exporter TauE/SafE family protein [Altererythrobacter sp. ZODW24]